jgi:hypothetical protein
VPGKPRVWSETPLFYAGVSNMDLASDGNRFVVVTAPDLDVGRKGSAHVTILENFLDELRRRVPAGK